MNFIQKYQHMIESYDCILNILLSILLLMNLLISLEICSIAKLSK